MFIWTESTYSQANAYVLPQTSQHSVLHFSVFEGRGINGLSEVSKKLILILQWYSC